MNSTEDRIFGRWTKTAPPPSVRGNRCSLCGGHLIARGTDLRCGACGAFLNHATVDQKALKPVQPQATVEAKRDDLPQLPMHCKNKVRGHWCQGRLLVRNMTLVCGKCQVPHDPKTGEPMGEPLKLAPARVREGESFEPSPISESVPQVQSAPVIAPEFEEAPALPPKKVVEPQRPGRRR